MKGWVYVMSNQAMAGLVKVGFSTKDPELRAEEMNHTGSPHRYVVDYEVLIEDPYKIEQKTHKLLSSKREAKEWYRCTAEEAIAAIKLVSATPAIVETYKHAERMKAEELHRGQLAAQKSTKDAQDRLMKEEAIIYKNFEDAVSSAFSPHPFWTYWLVGTILVMMWLAIFGSPKMSDGVALPLSASLGAIVAFILREIWESKRKESNEYLALVKKRDEQLAVVRNKLGGLTQAAGNDGHSLY